MAFTIAEGETLKLGVATSNIYGDGTRTTNNDGWFKVDDFRLEYGGGDDTAVKPLTVQTLHRDGEIVFNLSGTPLAHCQKGINIVQTANGRADKIFVRK